jgi:hypothetical protein
MAAILRNSERRGRRVNMRALLLAAGSGRRLQRPYPKCLVEIGAMTLLSRALRALATVGVSEAWVVVGYRHELIAAELSHYSPPLAVACIKNEAFLRGSVRSFSPMGDGSAVSRVRCSYRGQQSSTVVMARWRGSNSWNRQAVITSTSSATTSCMWRCLLAWPGRATRALDTHTRCCWGAGGVRDQYGVSGRIGDPPRARASSFGGARPVNRRSDQPRFLCPGDSLCPGGKAWVVFVGASDWSEPVLANRAGPSLEGPADCRWLGWHVSSSCSLALAPWPFWSRRLIWRPSEPICVKWDGSSRSFFCRISRCIFAIPSAGDGRLARRFGTVASTLMPSR